MIENGLAGKQRVRVRIANPNMMEAIWERIRGPQYMTITRRPEQITIIDLEEVRGTDGHSVFSELCVPKSGEGTVVDSDPIDGLIELFREHLDAENWEGIRGIGNSLLRDFGGRPGGMHFAAIKSPSIGTLSELVETIGIVCDGKPDLKELAGLIRRVRQDLSIVAEVG